MRLAAVSDLQDLSIMHSVILFIYVMHVVYGVMGDVCGRILYLASSLT